MTASLAPFWNARRRWVAVGLGLVAVLGLVVGGRNVLFGGLVARTLADRLGRGLGADITIGGVQGSWWQDLTCTDVVIRSGAQSITLPAVAVDYDLGLFRGDLGALRRITAAGVVGSFTTATAPHHTGVFRLSSAWPEALPELRLEGTASVDTARGPVEFHEVTVSAAAADIRVEAARVVIPGQAPFPLALTLERPDPDTLRVIQPVALPGLAITALAVTTTPTGLRVDGEATALGGRLDIHWTGDRGSLQLRDGDLAALPDAITAQLPESWRGPTGRAEVAVELRRDPAGAWLGEGRFTSAAARIGGREVRQLHGQVEFSAARWLFRDLAAEIDGSIQVTAKHLELRQIAGVFQPWAGGLDLHLEDIRPWAGLAGVSGAWLPTTPVALGLGFTVTKGVTALERCRITGPGLTIDASGTWTPGLEQVDLTGLHLSGDVGIVLRAVPAWSGIPGILARWRLPDLAPGTCPVEATGQVRWAAGTLTGTLTTLRLELPGLPIQAETFPVAWNPTAWSVGPVAGQIGPGRLALHLAKANVLEGTLDFTGVPFATTRASGTVDAGLTLTDDAFTLDRLVVASPAGRLEARGRWPRSSSTPGSATVTLDCPDLARTWPNGPLATGALRGSLALTGDGEDLQADLDVAVTDYRLRREDGLPAAAIPDAALTGKFHGTLTPRGATAQGSLNLGERPVLTVDAGLQPDAAGWRTGALSGQAVMTRLRLEDFPGLIPGIQRLSGQLDGRLELAGTPAHPAWQGGLTLAAGELKISPDVPTITDLAGQVRLGRQAMVLEDVHAQLGYAPARLGGVITWDNRQPRFDLTLRGENLLLARSPDLRVRADADLTLRGPVHDLVVAGKIAVVGALWSRPVELLDLKGGAKPVLVGTDQRFLLFSLRQGPQFRLRFDVDLKTRDAPLDEGLRILNDVIDARCAMDLHLGGSGEAPEPRGHITLREGTVRLPFSSLNVGLADLAFPPGEPFQPQISASASAQVGSHRVDALVTGPLLAPAVQLSSPGLDDRDCLLLLTAGATAAELEGTAGKVSALSRVGTYLGRQGWRKIRGPGDPDEGPGFLDRTTVEIGRETSNAGRDTILTETLLTPFGKRIGAYLTGERDRYDDYNLGLVLRIRFGGAAVP